MFYTVRCVGEDILDRYPLGRELALDRLRLESASKEDLRATPDTLRLQAEVAEASGRPQLGANLRRAAELATVPEEVVLEIYTALRPRRSTADELEERARELDRTGAPLTAAFVREAAEVYAARGLLA